MREIKFRGKSLKGKWVYGYYVVEDGAHFIIANDVWHEVHPETVGQWIGERDKKKTDLYEHDVVEWEDANKRSGIGIINYAGGEYFITQIDGYHNLFYDVYGATFQWNDLTKIGDIHSNPELLDKNVLDKKE